MCLGLMYFVVDEEAFLNHCDWRVECLVGVDVWLKMWLRICTVWSMFMLEYTNFALLMCCNL